jgi:4-hydroxy-tetrahydrodipicolinate reductase
MIKIGVNGACGKMGQRILALATEDPARYQAVQAFDTQVSIGKKTPQGIVVESVESYRDGKATLKCDVLIDFSGPEGAKQCLSAALSSKKALVIGSTGLDEDTLKSIEAAATKVPMVVSANMSIGVNLVIQMLEQITAKLPKDFDIEITEAHHRHKKDAPSGTALMLAKAIAVVKGWDLKKCLLYRKESKADQERSSDVIGMQVIRAGEIVGDHTVLFAGPAETIEITHKAQSRDTFARGALMAAAFAHQAKPGKIYNMKDVLK